jgi:hypothetical protein
MAFPSSPIEKQIDPPDGTPGTCSPPSTSGDTIRLGNNGNGFSQPADYGWVFTKNGPYEYNSKLWAAFVDTLNNTIEVWASADEGSTWAEVDSADAPSCLANTGPDETVVASRPEYGVETIAVAMRPEGDYPALYISYIDTSQQWAIAVFNLQSEAWQTADFITSTIDPFANSGAEGTMRPSQCLEYRAVNDDLVLFWNVHSADGWPVVYRVVITDTFGSESVFVGGTDEPRILYGSTVTSNGRCHIVTGGGSTDPTIYSRPFNAGNTGGSEEAIGTEDAGAFSSLVFGGQACTRADDTVVVTWWRQREQFFDSQLEYEVHAAQTADADSPSWTDKTVVSWKEKREALPVAVETSDGELYAIFTSSEGDAGNGNRIAYSLYDDDSETWGAAATLVDLTLPLEGTEACEFETNFDAYSALPWGNTFGFIFARGSGSFDPDEETDPRGARYDYSFPPWFWGSAAGAPELNYYGPLGPMQPGIVGGGIYSI